MKKITALIITTLLSYSAIASTSDAAKKYVKQENAKAYETRSYKDMTIDSVTLSRKLINYKMRYKGEFSTMVTNKFIHGKETSVTSRMNLGGPQDQRTARDGVCMDPIAKNLVNRGYIFKYNYSNEQGRYLYSVQVTRC